MNSKDDSPQSGLDEFLDQTTTRGGAQRRDPSFSHFEEPHDDGYEEPDRDTDFDSGYQTDSVEEDEEFDAAFPHEEDDHAPAAQKPDISYDPEPEDDEEPDDWLEQDDVDEAEAAEGQRWPMSLIVVAIVALALLGAGGYGVMQQRAATEAELRQLRASLATSASPEEVRTSRGALQELQRSYDKLRADAEALTLENRRLTDTVAGLEGQLGVQQSALTKASPVAAKPAATTSGNSGAAPAQPAADRFAPLQPAAKPAPKPAPAPTPAKEPPAMAPSTKPAAAAAVQTPIESPSASTASGQWFVNFGSYATHSMAESWAAKLNPGAGKVIIAPNTSAGKTLYRLRVVGLADRDTAKAVAHKLETDQRVSELWVGKE